MKLSERELELRRRREEALEHEERRRAHYAERERAAAVTKVSGESNDIPLASVTKIMEGQKRGRGRPPLLGTRMTGAERVRRHRARKKAEGKEGSK